MLALIGESGGDFGGGVGGRSSSLDFEKIRPNDNLRVMGLIQNVIDVEFVASRKILYQQLSGAPISMGITKRDVDQDRSPDVQLTLEC
jgi:hypothetical protein